MAGYGVIGARRTNSAHLHRPWRAKNETVAATPFPKFFNAFERSEVIPDQPFETFEKVDGSLIIIFWHAGEWKTATKGAFGSPQAQWAAARLRSCDLSALRRGTTYLAEAVYAENRIVVRYAEDELVLLAAYDESGAELSYASLCETADGLGWRMVKRHRYDSASQLVVEAQDLPRDAEGFVVRFDDGLRLKIKGAEYRRIHALISRITPLAMWEIMQAGDDLAKVRRDIPEEFWTDFDDLRAADPAARRGRRDCQARGNVGRTYERQGCRSAAQSIPGRHPGAHISLSQTERRPVVRPRAPDGVSLDPADGK